jgi:hypothetical protein
VCIKKEKFEKHPLCVYGEVTFSRLLAELALCSCQTGKLSSSANFSSCTVSVPVGSI